MKVYPAFLKLEGRPCLVVGGGAVGERKVLDLLAAGARVTVVSLRLTPRLQAMAAAGQIQHRAETFQPGHLEGMFLVVGATDDPETNRQISTAAQERRLLVNIVDAPDLCTFVVPATIRRGDLVVAIGTGGRSPALAKRLRQELETRFGPEYEAYLELLGLIREKVLARRRDHPDNAALFTRLADGRLLTCLQDRDPAAALALLTELLQDILPPAELSGLRTVVQRTVEGKPAGGLTGEETWSAV